MRVIWAGVVLLLLASPARAEKPIVAVFEIQTKRVRLDKGAKTALSDYLVTRLSASGAYQVVPRDQLRKASTWCSVWPISPELVRRVIATCGCEYVQTYRMTETSPYPTLSRLKQHLRRLPEEAARAFTADGWLRTGDLAVVLRPGAEVSAEALIACCREQLAGFKAPRRIRLCDALPKTGSGKIAKRLLRLPGAADPA